MTREKLAGVLPRAALDTGAALEQIRPVCEDVRDRGAAAVREYTARFDGVDLPTSRVPAQALADALATLSPELRAALEEMIRRVRPVHEAQRPADHVTAIGDGAQVTERYVAVDRAGVYVPAGLVPLPSSVIMNVVPAQVAGVDRIAVASPPRRDSGGLPAPAILAACALLGIEEVHAVGGAQAIAMFAYGTADCAAGGRRHRAGQRLRDRGQAAAGRHRRRGRRGGPDRDRDHRRPHRRPAVPRGRPGRAGRARPAGRVPADHHRPRARRAHRGRTAPAGRLGPAPRHGAGRPGRAVRLRARGRHRRRAGGLRRVGARAPGDPDGGRGRPGRAGPQRRRRLRRPVRPGLAGRLPGRVQPRAAHRRHRPAHGRAVRARLPARHPRGGLLGRGAGRGGAAHRRPRRGRGPRRPRQCGADPRGRCWPGGAPPGTPPAAQGPGPARGRPAGRGDPRTPRWLKAPFLRHGAAGHDGQGPAAAAGTRASGTRPGRRSGPTWPAGRRTGRRNWTCRSGSTPTRTPTRRHRRWSRRSRTPRPAWRARSTATRTGTRWRCAPTSPPISGTA